MHKTVKPSDRASIDADFVSELLHGRLLAAAGGGHREIVDRLSAAGADVNAAAAAKSGGRTALQAEAGEGHLEVEARSKSPGAPSRKLARRGGLDLLFKKSGFSDTKTSEETEIDSGGNRRALEGYGGVLGAAHPVRGNYQPTLKDTQNGANDLMY